MLDAAKLAAEVFDLLYAYPHKWGPGAIHIFDQEEDKTLCGKPKLMCEGELGRGEVTKVTCKVCANSRIKRLHWAAEHERWIKEASQRETERAAQSARQDAYRALARRQWWEAYSTYLQSPVWQDKRAKVMRRARGICEGCGDKKAVQVHHLRYPRGLIPGSREWIEQEKLFDLTAVCLDCHRDVHPEV